MLHGTLVVVGDQSRLQTVFPQPVDQLADALVRHGGGRGLELDLLE